MNEEGVGNQVVYAVVHACVVIARQQTAACFIAGSMATFTTTCTPSPPQHPHHRSFSSSCQQPSPLRPPASGRAVQPTQPCRQQLQPQQQQRPGQARQRQRQPHCSGGWSGHGWGDSKLWRQLRLLHCRRHSDGLRGHHGVAWCVVSCSKADAG
jgi:hypothetical protein